MLKPWLLNKLNQTFPDPSQFTISPDPKEAFYYAAMVTSVYKKVMGELINFIAQKLDEGDFLKKKELGQIKDTFAIGGDEDGS